MRLYASPQFTAAAQLEWPKVAAGIFAAAWLLAAWQPLYPQDWALENVLSLLGAWWLLRRHRVAPLSNAAYGMLCAFGVLHEVGSHYTYAAVPYDDWTAPFLAGRPVTELFGFARNHYDRFVHFAFGLLCCRPLREIFAPWMAPQRSWLAPLAAVAIASLCYEQIEMAAALVFGGDLGQAYLGTQGDAWDAQKDSAMAFAGALVATAAFRMRDVRGLPFWPD